MDGDAGAGRYTFRWAVREIVKLEATGSGRERFIYSWGAPDDGEGKGGITTLFTTGFGSQRMHRYESLNCIQFIQRAY